MLQMNLVWMHFDFLSSSASTFKLVSNSDILLSMKIDVNKREKRKYKTKEKKEINKSRNQIITQCVCAI